MKGLKDKTVLITGGSSGIGKATSLAFAREGTKVVVCSIQPEEGAQTIKEIRKAGGEAIFVEMDVTDSGQVQNAVRMAAETFGGLDFAFNNAGINGEVAPIPEYSEKGWDTVVDINLKGVWLCMKYEIPQMLKNGGGVIVNNASIGGFVSFPLDIAPYIASKHGVVGLTKAAARENAQKGIRVNAVCPGAVRTPLNQDIPDEIVKPIIDGHPMGRWGTPDEIAEMVLFLCSDAATFITGSSVLIDGGYTAQ
jgi:NAD(P)-dependent dehydrogenase (short-subunit alcohol dehydrogenase family)